MVIDPNKLLGRNLYRSRPPPHITFYLLFSLPVPKLDRSKPASPICHLHPECTPWQTVRVYSSLDSSVTHTSYYCACASPQFNLHSAIATAPIYSAHSSLPHPNGSSCTIGRTADSRMSKSARSKWSGIQGEPTLCEPIDQLTSSFSMFLCCFSTVRSDWEESKLTRSGYGTNLEGPWDQVMKVSPTCDPDLAAL